MPACCKKRVKTDEHFYKRWIKYPVRCFTERDLGTDGALAEVATWKPTV